MEKEKKNRSVNTDQLLADTTELIIQNQKAMFKQTIDTYLKNHDALQINDEEKELIVDDVITQYANHLTKDILNPVNISLIINSFLQAITNNLKNGKRVVLHGFGIFDISNVPAQEMINTFTNEKMYILARNQIHFKSGQILRNVLNNRIPSENGIYLKRGFNMTQVNQKFINSELTKISKWQSDYQPKQSEHKHE